MTSFLGNIAKEICKQFNSNLHEVAVIFPNRRAKVFFIDQLQKILEAPFLLPKIYSIDDFIESISNLKIKKTKTYYFHSSLLQEI